MKRINIGQIAVVLAILVAAVIIALSLPAPVMPLGSGSVVDTIELVVEPRTGVDADTSGVVTSTEVVQGKINGIYMDWGGTDAVTKTGMVIVGASHSSRFVQPVLSVTDVGTNTWYYPMQIPVNVTNTNIGVTGAAVPVLVANTLVMTVTGARAGNIMTATVLFERMR